MFNSFIVYFFLGVFSFLCRALHMPENISIFFHVFSFINSFSLLFYSVNLNISSGVITINVNILDQIILCTLSFLSMIYAFLHYRWVQKNTNLFSSFLFFSLFSSCGILACEDIFNFYVWTEVGIASCLGICFLFDSESENIWKYLYTQLIMSTLCFFSICFYYGCSGNFEIQSSGIEKLSLLFLLLVILAKIAIPPLHFWMYDVYCSLPFFPCAILITLSSKVIVYKLCQIFPNNLLTIPCFILTFWSYRESDMRKSLLVFSIFSSVYFMILYPYTVIAKPMIPTIYICSNILCTAYVFLCYELFQRKRVFPYTTFLLGGLMSLGSPSIFALMNKIFAICIARDNFIFIMIILLCNVYMCSIFHDISSFLKKKEIPSQEIYHPITAIFVLIILLNCIPII